MCDGKNGAPDLHYRFLLGTGFLKDAGQDAGSRSHSHRVTADSAPARGRDRRMNTGVGFAVRLPENDHRHRVDAVSASAEHLPLSMRVMFIMKVR